MPCLFTQQLGNKYGAPLKQCGHLLKVASDLGLDVVGVRYAILNHFTWLHQRDSMCYNHFDGSFMSASDDVCWIPILLHDAHKSLFGWAFVHGHGPFEKLRTIIGCDEPTCPQ